MKIRYVLTAALIALAVMPATSSAGTQVELSDARRAPDWMQLVHPGDKLNSACDLCECQFTDVSAYRWNGGALSAQRIDRKGRTYWKHPKGGRVYFDGCTFRNQTHRSVLVAVWGDA